MSGWPDRAIAKLAEVQEGQVTQSQLLGLGAGRGAIQHRISKGRLHRTFYCVYAGRPHGAPSARA
jgi:hypothetical protein